MAKALGWTAEEQDLVHTAGLLHDIGKFAFPDSLLLADTRLALQASPLSGRALTAHECLTLATRGSALGLGRPDLGSLEPGSAADLNVYDMTSVFDVGAADLLSALLWTSPGRRPRDVAVGGRVVVRDAELRTADAQALAAALRTRLSA